jgi:DNA-binding transcriptional MerR regulator
MKRSGGRRYYRPGDVLLLRGIRRLLYGEGYTIKGVQRILSAQGIGVVQQAGGASGEELAFAAELEDEASPDLAAIPAKEPGAAEPDLPREEDETAEAIRPQAQAPRPAVEYELVAPAAAAPEASVRPRPSAALSTDDRGVLEKVLEELRACARDLATVR